jgi:hypothetical protein
MNTKIKNIVDKIIRVIKPKNLDGWHEEFIVHLASVLKPKVYVEL